MINLNKKYVIGTHVMFFEIEMYKDFIDGLVNLLETVENKDNVTIDLCFNMSQVLEKIDYNKTSDEELLEKFEDGIKKLKNAAPIGMIAKKIIVVPCIVNNWLYISGLTKSIPGAANCILIKRASIPPVRKRMKAVTPYRTPIFLWSIVVIQFKIPVG